MSARACLEAEILTDVQPRKEPYIVKRCARSLKICASRAAWEPRIGLCWRARTSAAIIAAESNSFEFLLCFGLAFSHDIASAAVVDDPAPG
jgi:hypothetical protein